MKGFLTGPRLMNGHSHLRPRSMNMKSLSPKAYFYNVMLIKAFL